MLHLTVPGFFSPGQALTQARMSYLEQLAAYDPPAGAGAPRVVADYSGITGSTQPAVRAGGRRLVSRMCHGR